MPRNDKATTQKAVIHILRKLPLFSGLMDDEYKLLMSVCHLIELPRQKILFHADEAGHEIYLLLNGKIEIKAINSGHLGIIHPGEVVGEMAVVRDALRSATATAIEDSLLFRINQSDLDLLLGKSPRVSYLIMKNIARELAERLATSNNHHNGIS
ncbi:MAG: cyclic nucleotide-binding domain-containing protein [Gammaproteobacteria bacterium]|nr:cyclic nucleotide-binding domain-containing protein [Gammaproteobacteria bacterium]MCW8982881.1 cyclic nucleotide-binding domain-containing protein [Gammaproteobacteria bacterium]